MSLTSKLLRWIRNKKIQKCPTFASRKIEGDSARRVVWLLCSCLRVNTQRSSLCYVTTKRTFECTNVMGLVSSLKEWLFRGHISSRGRQNLWKKSIVCHSAKNILGITGIFTWKRKRKRTLYHRFYTMKKKLTFPCCHRSILYVCVMFAEKKFLFSSTTGLHSLFWRPPSVKKKKQKKNIGLSKA